ncbi:MAG TPA: hypothetical protein VKZ53_03390 [Candidatus Angelobacter sp.]|nr:hypothetical protein [Candidatus Angelobacter sp.]
MPKKKKQRQFRASKAVKAAARTVIGAPPPVRRDENRKRTPSVRDEKYKPTLGKMLSDS